MSDTTSPFQSALGDPFAPAGVSNLSQPGFLGVSPDVWRSLAGFGGNLAASANARDPRGFLTYGQGFAGPFGAAISQSQQQGLERGTRLSDMEYRRAAAQGQNIQNYTNLMQLPFIQAQQQLQYRMLTDPEFRASFAKSFGFDTPTITNGTTGGSGGASSGTSITPFVAKNLPNGVTPEEDQIVRTVWGESRGEPVAGQQAVASVIKNRMRLGGQSAQDVIFSPNQFEPWNNPQTRAQLEGLDPNSPQYQVILNNAVRPVMSGQVQDPTGGATHFYSPQLQASLGRQTPAWATGNRTTIGNHDFYYGGYGGNGGTQVASTDTTPQKPYQVAQAGNGPIPVPNGQGLVRNSDGSVGTPGGGFASPPQQPPQQQTPPQQPPQQSGGVDWMAQANAYEARANQLEAAQKHYAAIIKQFPALASMIPPPVGDPAALRQAAQQYRATALAGPTATAQEGAKANVQLQTAGPIKRAETENTITTDRFGNRYLGTQYIGRGPEVRETYNSETGNYEYKDVGAIGPNGQPIAPGSSPSGNGQGAPASTTEGAVVAKPGPGKQQAIAQAGTHPFDENATKQYQSAVGTVRAMEDLDHQFDVLNGSGPSWYNTGDGAHFRLELGKSINAIASSAGLPPIFDPEKLASGEDVVKQAKLAGMQALASFFGGQREAASIVQSTQSAVPNLENTPQGAKLVLNGVREGAQWIADQHEFMVKWFNDHGGNMIGADVAFNKQVPSQMYTRRAISMIKPFDISSDKELTRYLPGTFVVYKGNVVQVPPREGMPAVPEYMTGARPYQMPAQPQQQRSVVEQRTGGVSLPND